MMKFFAFLVLVTLWTGPEVNSLVVLDLSSKNVKWTVTNTTKQFPAQVPGSIYSDLERAKEIPEIYRDFNDIADRWVGNLKWTYETQFDLDKESPYPVDILTKKYVNLVAHGLDTVGEVILNGKSLGKVDNQFVRYQWPVKELLKEKANKIEFHFEPSTTVAKEMYERIKKEHYGIPPVCVPAQQQGECHVNMLRKMQASFSWDWGPAFPTQGIWQPLTLEGFNDQMIRSISVDTQPQGTTWSVEYSIFLESGSSLESKFKLDLYLDDVLLEEREVTVNYPKNGEAKLVGKVQIPESKIKVKPWFPNGAGEQKLYSFSAKITASSPQEAVTKSVQIGFRTVKLVQERENSTTEAYSFYFTVNDKPIWAKGSNWIPAHVLTEQLSREYIRELLWSAKEANMNMLRVWGGGIYESEWFYEAADEFGIMIWQDMMFACAAYPAEEKFLDSVKIEIQQQIRRLQHHPSIAIWAGNNENEAALADGWWEEVRKGQPHYEDYRKDYRTLYIDTIKPIVEAEDKSRSYVPSSPSNGVEDVKENYLAANPQDWKFGDVHFYTTTGDVWDWTRFPSAKFASEYGFQSWSSLKTFSNVIEKKSLVYPLDADMKHREHSPGGLEALNTMIALQLPLPSPGAESKLEDYIYVSQIFQSMAIKIETEFYRRNRAIKPNGDGHTMGALYWQLNDIWPTVSWASVEFGGKWKMLQYYAQNFFNNLLVNAYEDHGIFKLDIVRDDHQDEVIHFGVHLNVFEWSKLEPIYAKEFTVETKPFSVTEAYIEPMADLLTVAKCPTRAQCFIEVSLWQSTVEKRSNFLLLDKPKNAAGLPKAKIILKEVTGPVNEIFTLHLETDNIAPWVWLDLKQESKLEGIFSDNGFFLTTKTKTLELKLNQKGATKEDVAKNLLIKSLKDVE